MLFGIQDVREALGKKPGIQKIREELKTAKFHIRRMYNGTSGSDVEKKIDAIAEHLGIEFEEVPMVYKGASLRAVEKENQE